MKQIIVDNVHVLPHTVEDPGNFPEIVVGCPPDITATLAVNRDLAQVFWFQPQAVDRNGNQATTVGSHEPGSMFPAGFTTVTYTFTDFENNVAFCSFMVLVNGKCKSIQLVWVFNIGAFASNYCFLFYNCTSYQ